MNKEIRKNMITEFLHKTGLFVHDPFKYHIIQEPKIWGLSDLPNAVYYVDIDSNSIQCVESSGVGIPCLQHTVVKLLGESSMEGGI